MGKIQNLEPRDFVALHNHTHYSLLDGLQKVPAMVDRIKELGMEAVAITDHGTLSGAIELYKEARSKNIKPVIGIETYVASRKHTDKEPNKDKINYHLILLAMNDQGYKNLMRLSTIANLEGFYYKPRIDHELLEKYNEGLIVLSACIGGEVGDALRNDQYQQAVEIAQWYKNVFGDRYYLELQDHGHPDHPHGWHEQQKVNEQLIKLSKELSIPCVVTMDAHYRVHEDQEAHEILLCVQTGSFYDEESRMSLKEFELHIADPLDVIARWQNTLPEAVSNTRVIADRCNIELTLGGILIPKFPLPKNTTEKQYLDTLVYQGLAYRYGGVDENHIPSLTISEAKQILPDHVKERAEYELQIVDQMGFNGYFLIIADFMNWGKSQGIVFGPGRGSAAGSIIAYSLKITELDPLKFDLLFERFLNPDRISMPDIDIDIQDTRRDEVIQYCVEKYGDNRVANIVTFGKMAARNAVRDVARVLRVSYADSDRLAKMIPPPVQGRHIPLEVSVKENTELRNEYEHNPVAKRVFDLAFKLEGTIRSHGVHAAGVVIAPDDIVNYVPLEKAQKGVIATQYSMGPVEELGLLKMDFLGLSNLTTINNALRIIKKVYGKEIDIDRIPMDDKKTFELLARGDTTGVFQLESAGMKRYLKELQPTVFEDIVAMVALYRPGPMQFIDDFIARKHGHKKIEYDTPEMEAALSTTYGVLVYQEQVMQISKDLAGFTGGQADTLRKGIAKKIPEVLSKMKVEFIEGAIQNSNADREAMNHFWKKLEDFAAYCFNKSHAACYGLIAYQTAYLKAHYPAAFMASLMTSDFDDTDRLTIEMSECQSMGIEVLAPDVNESFVEFAVVPDKQQIRFGMSAVKNVGVSAVEEILRARNTGGPFSSLEDFLNRVNSHVVNRKTLESLIKTGGFDRYGSRSQLLNNIDSLLAFSQKKQRQKDSGQTDLFGEGTSDEASHKIIFGPEEIRYTQKEFLQWERELLGLYLTAHPLTAYKELLAEQAHAIIEIDANQEGKKAVIGGIVADVRVIQTKNGQNMAFVKFADLENEIELLLFPRVYEETSWLWVKDKVLIVEGEVNTKDKEGNSTSQVKLAVNKAREIPHEEAINYKSGQKKSIKKLNDMKPKKRAESKTLTQNRQRLYIRMSSTDDESLLRSLKTILAASRGKHEVVLVIGDEKSKQVIRIPERIEIGQNVIQELETLCGASNIKVVEIS